LPMLGWTFTGLIFFIKPGYKGAYEQLALKTYPLEKTFTLPASSTWEEARLLRTMLGYHLLVKAEGKTMHLDPISLQPKTAPSNAQYTSLLQDAFTRNQARYGEVVSIDAGVATTSTGVEVTLDWNSMRLRQKGRDTKLIKLMYQIHYLQWTPFKGVNQIVGIIGLLLLITLTLCGIKVYQINRERAKRKRSLEEV